MNLRLLPLLAMLVLASACQGNGLGQAREAAIAASNAKLPAPYRDGLVTERAYAGGADLVLDIRFAEARVADLETKPHLRDALLADETEAMIELCTDAALKPYLAAGGVVRRRFIDADGALFFEATLPANSCPTS
ncbi:MAG: hypothetical protein ACI4NW_00915 [Stenotrophomonas sp.]